MKIFGWLKSLIVVFIMLFLTGSVTAQLTNLIYITSVDISDDGRHIADAGIQPDSSRGFLQIIDSATGAVTFQINPMSAGFSSVAWSSDNRYIAAGSFDQSIWIIDLATERHVFTLRGHQGTVTSVSWDSTGTRLVSSGSWDRQVILWDMRTLQPIYILEIDDPQSVQFSPNDMLIAVGARDLFVFPSTLQISSSSIRSDYRYSSLYAGDVSWSNTGEQIAVSSQTYVDPTAQIQIIDVETRELLHSIDTNTQGIYGLAWSPSDDLIAAYSIDGLTTIWEVETESLLNTFPGDNRYAQTSLTFSTYGGRLFYGVPFASVFDQRQINTTNGVAVVVPVTSLERLQSIARLCDAPTIVEQAIPLNAQVETVSNFTRVLRELPEGTIPPACAADLIAVAEALS